MNFSKEEFKAFREEIKEAVSGVEKKFGVEIKFGSITYTDSDFKMKMDVSNGSIKEAKEVEFSRICTHYGLTQSDFGRSFTNKGKVYTISGIDTKRRKYPIMMTDEDGVTKLFTVDGIKRLIELTN